MSNIEKFRYLSLRPSFSDVEKKSINLPIARACIEKCFHLAVKECISVNISKKKAFVTLTESDIIWNCSNNWIITSRKQDEISEKCSF